MAELLEGDRLTDRDRPMMITMGPVLVMKVITDNIVNVIAVGNGVMSALRVMAVLLFVALTHVI